MSSLDKFLYKYKNTDKKNVTHTRIGNKQLGVMGGSYTIPDEEMSLFYKLYHKKVFIDNRFEHLTEKQLSMGGCVLVDLDFRYDKSIETRQHTLGHIDDIVELYLTEIQKLVDIENENATFPLFILEKPNVNTLENVTKDGIHLVIGIHMDQTLKQLLRLNVLKGIESILEDLPLENDITNALDASITRSASLWQLFGSRKPGNEAYQIKKYYTVTWKNILNYHENPIPKKNMLKILPIICARNKNNIKCTIKEKHQKIYEEQKKKVYKKVYKIKKNIQTSSITDIKNKDDLKQLVAKYLENLKHEDFHIQETHQFAMILPEKFYNNFDEWIRVGWALHNTDRRMFLTWMLFSSQSSKFKFDDISNYYEQWQTMLDEGITQRSIMYWAKEFNKKEYYKIKMKTVGYYLDKTLKGKTDWDIAHVLYQLFKDKFACISFKNSIWYEFKDGRWFEIDSGITLRREISRTLAQIYNDKMDSLYDLLHITEDENKQAGYKDIIKILAEIVIMIKKTNRKEAIMKESRELFFNSNFIEKLDTNPYLLCFNNGVIDFENKIFRKGRPEDYISLSTNRDYIPFNPKNSEHVQYKKEIEQFMEQLFPNEKLNKYMWQHLASTLIGTNENQTFNIYNGVGRNGKSKLVEFMGLVLGDYKGTVPITLITQKRNSIGGSSPEIAQLRGTRYAVMQEPSKGDKINEGIMKEITGGDPIQGRALYKDTITFIPQFTLVVCTNNLFDIKSNDDGTWRRIRVCDFISKFVENPSTNAEENEYAVDKKIESKFKKWLSVFTALLIEKAFETNGIVEDCETVLFASSQYRREQDYLGDFFEDHIGKEEGRKIKKTEVYEEFKIWYGETYGKNIPKGKELYSFLEKKLGKYKKGGWHGYTIKYDD